MEEELERLCPELGRELAVVQEEMVEETELTAEEKGEKVEAPAKRARLAQPVQIEEEIDYVAELGELSRIAASRYRRLGFSRLVEETRGRSSN